MIRIANPRSAILQKALSTLPYERFVGFASMQSLWSFNFGHPCPSLVKGEVLSPEKIRATTGGIATPPTFPKTHYPLPRTISLPPLSKVRCCRPKKIRATTGGIALHPPAFQSPQPSQKHINRFAPHHVLASPRKRGSGTAVEVFRLAVQYSDSPAFTILELFRAVTVGIAPHPHQPSQTRTIPLAFRR